MDSYYFDETWCSGIACGHPSCWNSQRKIIRGQAKFAKPDLNSSRTFDNIPTQKIQSVNDNLFGYDDWMSDVNKERSQAFVKYVKARSKPSVKTCMTPPNSTHDRDSQKVLSPTGEIIPSKPKVRQLEPHEILSFDDFDNKANYPQNSKLCYIWVPNPSRLKRKKKLLAIDSSAEFLLAPVVSRDVTKECLIPKSNTDKENTYIPHTPVTKRPTVHTARSHKSPIKGSPRHYSLPPLKSSSISHKMQDNVASLMEMKPEILSDVLDHIEQGELPSSENIERVVRTSKYVRKSHETADLECVFEQKKVSLHDPEEKLTRCSEIHSSHPIFRLDETQTSAPLTERTTDQQMHDLFSSQHLPLPPIESDRSKQDLTLHDKSKMVPDGKSSATRAHSTAISNISTDHIPISRKRNEVVLNPKYGPPVNLFLGPISGTVIEETKSETPCSDDSRSINVTVSTDRSTLYQEVLPGVKTFQPKVLCVSPADTESVNEDPPSPSNAFIPITHKKSSEDDRISTKFDAKDEDNVSGEYKEDTPEEIMLSAFESLFYSDENIPDLSTHSMNYIAEIEEEDDEISLHNNFKEHFVRKEERIEIPVAEIEDENEDKNLVSEILPTETSRFPLPPPPSPEPSSRSKVKSDIDDSYECKHEEESEMSKKVASAEDSNEYNDLQTDKSMDKSNEEPTLENEQPIEDSNEYNDSQT